MSSVQPVKQNLRDVPEVVRAFVAAGPGDLVPELLLFARCLFVAGDHGFADCDAADVATFLEPVQGLPQAERRRAMLKSLARIVPNPSFDIPDGPPAATLSRRALAHEVFRRTAAKRARMTQMDAVRTEQRSGPFYAAIREVFGPPSIDTSHYEPVIARATRHLAERPGGSVLDVGCAYGLMLDEIGRRVPGTRLVGTDMAPQAGRIVALGDAQPFGNHRFDVVTITGVFEHVLDMNAQAAELARLVKADGVVIGVTIAIHVRMLERDPMSYVEGALSTLWPDILPPYHALYEPLSPLALPHIAYTRHQLRGVFEAHFAAAEVTTMQFAHLRKFGLERLAPRLPLLRHFGGQLLVVARGPRR